MSDMSHAFGDTLNAITLDSMHEKLGPAFDNANANIDMALDNVKDGNLTPGQLLYFQNLLARFTILIEFIATIEKSISDSIKSTIQKMG